MGSVRISEALETKIQRVAMTKGITRSEVFRRALEAYCNEELAPKSGSRFDDIIGVVDVPGDFSVRTRSIFGEIVKDKACKSRG